LRFHHFVEWLFKEFACPRADIDSFFRYSASAFLSIPFGPE
jgi:hypothetical protein